MKNQFIIIILFIFGCSQNNVDKTEIIQSLKSKIDSVEMIPKSNELYYQLIDSFYAIDPGNNYILPKVVNKEFNIKNDSLVIVLSQQLFETKPVSFLNIFYGLSLERYGLEDSAKQHYKHLLKNYPDSMFHGKYTKYELLTIVYGKDSALSEFNKVPILNDFSYYSQEII